MNIKIALIQIGKKHTEIMGTFVEYFVMKNFSFDIFYDLENDNYSFINYYKTFFNANCNIYSPDNLIEYMKNYDYFIFTTSADKIKHEFAKFPSRCIYVSHQPTHPRSFMIKNIIVSPNIRGSHFNANITEYVLPIYKSYNESCGNYNSNILGIIGAIRFHEKDKDVNLLLEILNNYNEKSNFSFHIFMRRKDWNVISKKYKILKNNKLIQFFPGLKTEDLIKRLKQCKYILPLAKIGGWFHWQRLTGALPLGINMNIPLIVDEKLKNIYNLKGVITYKNSINTVIDYAIKINKNEYNKLITELIDYKNRIVAENHLKLDDLILRQRDTKFHQSEVPKNLT